MKNFTLILLFSFLCLTAFFTRSQSLQVHDLSGNDVTGTTVDIWLESTNGNFVEAPFDVKNISGSALSVKVRKIETSVQAGTSNTFCFNGNCFLSSVFVSPTAASVGSGEKDTTFKGDFYPKGINGTSIITYKFFRTDDTTDFATVIVRYNASPVGIQQHNASFTVSSPYPNPATTHASFSYSFPEKSVAYFTLSDITGSIIKEIPILNHDGVLEITTSDLSEGIYFYSFYLDGIKLMTKKLIVQ